MVAFDESATIPADRAVRSAAKSAGVVIVTSTAFVSSVTHVKCFVLSVESVMPLKSIVLTSSAAVGGRISIS
jgi:hypothetical protein